MPSTLVLASASPRRAELLRLTGLAFEVAPTGEDETLPPGMQAAQAVVEVARRKAAAALRARPDAVVLAADTVVVVDGDVLAKPGSTGEAAAMLRTLSGRPHTVMTGLCVARSSPGGDIDADCTMVETRVWFFGLTDAMIDAYIATGEPMDKAGAYGIQGRASLFVERIDGDYFNVVGLPVSTAAGMLARAGFVWWQPAG